MNNELIIKTTDKKFQIFLGDKELGLIWQDYSIIDCISVFHPKGYSTLKLKIVFKNFLGGLHEAYHDKVLQTMNKTMWAIEDADIDATFWLRPQLANINVKNKRIFATCRYK